MLGVNYSAQDTVCVGVPRGSVLDLAISSSFIKDLSIIIHMGMFTDDCIMYSIQFASPQIMKQTLPTCTKTG